MMMKCYLHRYGRTALHHAAIKGSTEACEVLMDNGALLFNPDFMGNMPMHFAASGNKVKTLDFLAGKGQEFTRSITSDKVPVKTGI